MKSTILTLSLIAGLIAGLTQTATAAPAVNVDALYQRPIHLGAVYDAAQVKTIRSVTLGVEGAPRELTIIGDLSSLRTRLELLNCEPYIRTGDLIVRFIPITLGTDEGAAFGAQLLASRTPFAYVLSVIGTQRPTAPEGQLDTSAVLANTKTLRAAGMRGAPMSYYVYGGEVWGEEGKLSVDPNPRNNDEMLYKGYAKDIYSATFKRLGMDRARLNLLTQAGINQLETYAGAEFGKYKPADRRGWVEKCGLNAECWQAPK